MPVSLQDSASLGLRRLKEDELGNVLAPIAAVAPSPTPCSTVPHSSSVNKLKKSGIDDDLDVLTEVLRAKLDVSWVCVGRFEPSLVSDSSNSNRSAPPSWTFVSTASAANRDLNFVEISRDYPFGQRTIQQQQQTSNEMLVVPDTLLDERLVDHPLVTLSPNFRFYAGCSLRLLGNDDASSSSSNSVASLCVLDSKPREMNVDQLCEIKRTAKVIEELLLSTKQLQPPLSDETQPTMRKRSSCSDLAAAEAAASAVSKNLGSNGTPVVSSSHSVGGALLKLPVDSATSNSSGKRSRSNSLVRRSQSEKSIPKATFVSLSVPPPVGPLILPSPSAGNNMDPDEFLVQLVTALYPQVQLKTKPALELEEYFSPVTEEQMARYTMEIVNVARSNDLVALKAIHAAQGPEALSCFNRFGEGLLNMACRRGFNDMVNFFLHEANLAVRVRDDYGRTPLHDACWSPEPQLQICTWIMSQDPSLFLVKDKRGFTPFQYARECDWPIWRQFLVDNLEHLHKLASPEIATKFS